MKHIAIGLNTDKTKTTAINKFNKLQLGCLETKDE